MELSETITLDGTRQFCDEGNRLALQYLAGARDALRKDEGARNESGIKNRVLAPLETFLSHTRECGICR